MRYPEVLIDTVIEHAGVGRALEIGCGTGIATVPFARRGMRITAVEPSPEMAAVARRNLAEFPDVSLDVGTYEEWEPPAAPFDLVYAAQSWHWITPEAKFEKTPALLRPDGYLAVFGMLATGNFKEGQEAYARWAPKEFSDEGPPPSTEERIASSLDPIREHYRDVELWRWPFARTYTAEEYVRLVSTYSDHSTLPVSRRTRLYEGLAVAIEQAGGTVERHYEAVLIGARP